MNTRSKLTKSSAETTPISPAPLKKSIVKMKTSPAQKVVATPTREKTYYDLGKLIDWIENATNADLRSPPTTLSPEQIELRNKKLFPFIKESFLYVSGRGCELNFGTQKNSRPAEQQRILVPESALGTFFAYLNQLLPNLPNLTELFEAYKKKLVLGSSKCSTPAYFKNIVVGGKASFGGERKSQPKKAIHSDS